MVPIQLHPMDFYLRMDQQEARCIVIFVAPSCGGCRRLLRMLAQAEELALSCFQVNAEEAGFLLDEYELQHLPAVLCFEGGECIGAIEELGRVADLLHAALALPTIPRR